MGRKKQKDDTMVTISHGDESVSLTTDQLEKLSDRITGNDHAEATHEAVPGVVIRKIELDGMTASLAYDETLVDFTKLSFTRSSGALMHGDFIAAMAALKTHVAFLCDLKESEHLDILDAESLQNIYVHGLSFKGEHGSDKEELRIQAVKYIGGKALKLVTPEVLISAKHEEYKYIDELRAAVDTVLDEAREYMNGKSAEKQMSMDFADLE
ncbi:MAG TPA: hypothetical protein VEY71_02820 [Chitinophagales bacterium]|nr:hypothetical protein [Chitinophagales bacterium]